MLAQGLLQTDSSERFGLLAQGMSQADSPMARQAACEAAAAALQRQLPPQGATLLGQLLLVAARQPASHLPPPPPPQQQQQQRELEASPAAPAARLQQPPCPPCPNCTQMAQQLAARDRELEAMRLRLDNLLLERARLREEAARGAPGQLPQLLPLGREWEEEGEEVAFQTARSATAPPSGASSTLSTAQVRALGAEEVTWGRTLTARPPVPRPPHVPAVRLAALRK